MASPVRIASLVPAATDIVASLGLEAALVGVSHECDHPAADGLPALTSATIPAAGLDGEIDPGQVDEAVTATLESGAALYRTDLDLLTDLDPDVIIGQRICDVCAVSTDSLVGALPARSRLVTLAATSLDGLWHDIQLVADAIGAPERAIELVATLRARIDAVSNRSPAHRPSTVALEWGDPPFIGGHWIPELVERAGGRHLLGSTAQPSRRVDWNEIVASDPDIVLYVPCGYRLDVAVDEARRLLPPIGLAGRIVVADAGRLFSRCTPVVAEAIEGLAAVFDGDEPPDGFAGL